MPHEGAFKARFVTELGSSPMDGILVLPAARPAHRPVAILVVNHLQEF